MQRAVLILALAALCSPALAQRSRAQTPPPAAAPAAPAAGATPAGATPAVPAAPGTPAPTPPEPQRTTATFADWVLRCVRPEKAPATCEVGQTLYDKGQPVPKTAIGRPRPAEPMHLAVMVPVNVSLTAQPRLVGA